jgi:hypothetical protein
LKGHKYNGDEKRSMYNARDYRSLGEFIHNKNLLVFSLCMVVAVFVGAVLVITSVSTENEQRLFIISELGSQRNLIEEKVKPSNITILIVANDSSGKISSFGPGPVVIK